MTSIIFSIVSTGWLSVEDIKTKKVTLWKEILLLCIAILYLIIFRPFCWNTLFIGMLPGLLFLLFSFISKEKIGYADSIWIVILGMLYGITVLFRLLLYSFMISFVVSVIIYSIKRKKETEIAFLPCILVGQLILLSETIR